MLRHMVALTVLFLCMPIAATGAVIHVPGDQPTIQAGIDAASAGDTVMVADGTYTGDGNRDLDFFGKSITVRSVFGPENCIIDCQGTEEDPHRGFYLQSGEGEDSVIQGFTIINGGWKLTDNYYGGGIYCLNYTSPTIIDNVISDCVAVHGSGICTRSDCSPIISNNVIINNGGGVGGSGGGIQIEFDGTPIISGNTISNNSSLGGGGGISVIGGASPVITNNTISYNSAGGEGGGLRCGDETVVVNNSIHGNTAGERGGGISCDWNSYVWIMNNTITANSAAEEGGAIYCDSESSTDVINTIMWDNDAPVGKEIYVAGSGPVYWPTELFVSYSVLDGGLSSVETEPYSTMEWGSGMIDADPLFASGPDGDFYLSQLAAGQVADSPCLDAGNTQSSGICYTTAEGTVCLDQRSTRTDLVPDEGFVDIGFHYACSELNTVSTQLQCVPASGFLPLTVHFDVMVLNNESLLPRRIHANMDVTLANGTEFFNWKGPVSLVLTGGASLDYSFSQYMPASIQVVGINTFRLHAVDVTPAPYNQPPYPPSGSTDTDTCTVNGIMP